VNKSKQPVIKIEKDKSDIILEWVALIVAIILVALPLYYFNDLSENIPTHFGSSGKADGFGSKGSLFILPVLGVGIYMLITYLSRRPHQFNYPSKITPENAREKYFRALKMMRYLNVIILVSLLYISWVSIQNGLGHPMNLGPWFTPVFLISTLGVCFWPILKK